ncbi:MAG: translation initiation factor IF-2 [Candidatus Hecatellales archaeon]|nr:MAG: translation initiation factor IF-2 [Candidatus Hecatellales archaeon]
MALTLRQPIVAVLGHVDHGKTTLLDRIRGTAVAAREPGAITQHIGASFVPTKVLEEFCGELLKLFRFKIEIPGLLFIDTPGHSAFSNLRRRGGSVADIAILVVDVMEGVQPQTVESLEILKTYKTPFVVAANKIDLIPGWKSKPDKPVLESLKTGESSVLRILDEKVYTIIGSLSYHGFNSERFDRIRDFTRTVAVIPISAKTGEGLPDLLAVLAGLTQQYMKKRLTVSLGPAKGTILEIREDVGLGVNVNAIIYDGVLHKNDLIVLGGKEKPIVTKVRAILVPKPLDEIRDPREKFSELEEVYAAAGVKIVAPGLEDAIAGGPIYGASGEGEVEELLRRVEMEIRSIRILTDKVGVVLKSDTLGSLEALVNELRKAGIPIRIADVGEVSKRDVVEASVVKNEDPFFGVVLGFNVKVLPDAEEEALKTGVKIFQNNVIYKLLEDYEDWVRTQKEAKTRKTFESLIKPGKIRFLQGFVFRRSNPAIFGVEVLAGRIKPQYPLIRMDGTNVGKIAQIQDKGQNIPEALKGMKVAISMREPTVGRHVRENDVLYVDVPEEHLKVLLREFKDMLTDEDLNCINEFVEVKRKKVPHFGFGI